MLEVTVRIKGRLDQAWADWFDGFELIHLENDESDLKGNVQDQSALYGLLSKLRDLGVSLVEVKISQKKN